MVFNVSQLLKETTGATRQYELAEDISELDSELVSPNPLVGHVRMLRTHSGVLVTGDLSTAVQVTCNRCLGPVMMPVRFQVEEGFRPLTDIQTGRYIRPEEFEGEEEVLEDAALLINEQHMLDLSEVVRQNIWLAMPSFPTCDNTDLPLCPNEELRQAVEAQANEASGGEASPEEKIDPRWSALLKFEGKNDGDKPEANAA